MPFDDLPPEIIQRVFRLCCRSVKFTIPQYDGTRSRTTQVTLSLVCSRWREIAVNTSALWGQAVVIYEAGRERAKGTTASFQFVQNWLNRAGMTPISLSISVDDARKSQIAAISQTLLSSFRITNLYLKSHHSLLLVPTNNSSHLERLHLSFEPEQTTNTFQPTDTFPQLPEMPSLKELQLCLDPRDLVDMTNIYLIPWHQLRVFILRANAWRSQMLFNVLQRCKSLVRCRLLMKPEYEQLEHNIVLPNLESLVLRMDGEYSADPIIQSLTVPNLRSLKIGTLWGCKRIMLSTEAILIMAQRSGFNKCLTDFSLCRLTYRLVDVRSLLGLMPALERVRLHGPLKFQPGTFDDLSSGTIGPQLKEIRFGDMTDEEIGLLLKTVGQRHEKAKTVSDIKPFASVTCCTDGRQRRYHERRAKQCSKAFNTDVTVVHSYDFLTSFDLDSDSEV